jgi:asparagine N-glycosylation enzyme membrane subunit Stt3
MVPRLPEQRGRRRAILPFVLAALAIGALILGWVRGDTGFVIMGVVCLAGAALSFFTSAAIPDASERQDQD